MEITRKRLISTTLTMAVVALLYFSGPTTAINVALAAITGSYYPGETVNMSATITLQDYEFLMTTGTATLNITDPNSGIISCSLPINGTNTDLVVTCSDNRNITVTSTSGNGLSYDYAYGYDYGYNYAYGLGYTSSYNYSYGYGYKTYAYNTTSGTYRYQWTATTLAYAIKWPIASNATNGTYTAVINAYAGSTNIGTSSSRTITVASLTALPRSTVGVRISELMPNPTGTDNAALPGGEWVELENNGSSSVNVSGWTLVDTAGYGITIAENNSRTISNGVNTNSTVIPANGYLVVYRNAATMSLNNDEDTVTLKNASNTIIDIVPYNAADFSAAGLFSGIAATTFPENWSIILQAGVNESACGGVWIGGMCYSATNSSSPGASNPGSTAAFTKTLVNGYNLVSIPTVPGNTSTPTTFGSINGNYSVIWAYNASDTADPWKSYNPAAPSLSDLNNTVEYLGYWVRVNTSANQTLSVVGTAPISTNQTLIASSYNLIGYPSNTVRNVSTALTTIDGNYNVVWMYNASDTSDPWKSFIPGAAFESLNDLNNTYPGFGYWVRINASTNQTLAINY